MAFGFFKRAKDPEEIALDLEKRYYKQKNIEQEKALFGGVEDPEVLARLYRKIGGADRMLGFGAGERQEALLSRITDQNVLAGFLLEGQPERRTDESTRCILSHIDEPGILKNIALNASDAGMRYACEMKKPVLPHEPGSRWSFTQAEAAKRIPDRGVLAELLVRNGFRPELLALFEDCPQKEEHYLLLAEKGDFKLRSAALCELVNGTSDPAKKLWYASRIEDPARDYKTEQTFDDVLRKQGPAWMEELIMTTDDAPTQQAFVGIKARGKIGMSRIGDEVLEKFFRDGGRDAEARKAAGEYLIRKEPEAFRALITEDYVDGLLAAVTSAGSDGKLAALKTLRMLEEKDLIPESRRERISGLIWNESEMNRYGIIHYREGSTDIWTLGRKL